MEVKKEFEGVQAISLNQKLVNIFALYSNHDLNNTFFWLPGTFMTWIRD